MRLSILLSNKESISRRAAKEAIKSGLVKVDGRITVKDIETHATAAIECRTVTTAPKFDMQDYLLSQNSEVIFLYKPPFMHSERLRPDDALTMSDILSSFDSFHGLSRLDYEADGVIAIVKDDLPISFLRKKYLAVTDGEFPEEIRAAWQIDAENRKKVQVIENDLGNFAIMKRLEYNGTQSLIEVTLKMAARHQVRAFCAHAGYPIKGDIIYGGTEYERLMLHCAEYTVNNHTESAQKHSEQFIQLFRNMSDNPKHGGNNAV